MMKWPATYEIVELRHTESNAEFLFSLICLNGTSKLYVELLFFM